MPNQNTLKPSNHLLHMAERKSPKSEQPPWEENIDLIRKPGGLFRFLFKKRRKRAPFSLKYFTIDGHVIYYAIYNYPELFLRIPEFPPHPSLLYELVSFEAPPHSPAEFKVGDKISLKIWRYIENKYVDLDGILIKFFGIAEEGDFAYYSLPSGVLVRLCLQRVVPSAIIERERVTDNITKILFYYQENPSLHDTLPTGHKKALLKLVKKVK